VLLEVPSHAAKNLLATDVGIPAQHLSNKAAVSVALAPVNRYLLTRDKADEVPARCIPEGLAFFGRVDAGQAYALFVSGVIEQGNGIAVRNVHYLPSKGLGLRFNEERQQNDAEDESCRSV
jgi:hypothetical protein